MPRSINGTFRKVIRCEDCAAPAVTALMGWNRCKDLCRECALEHGADTSDLEDSNV